LKCDGTRAETRFRLSAKQTTPFKSAGASVQSTTGSRGVRISGSNTGYTMFRGSVKSTGYPLHSPVSPSLPLPCVTVCHHVSTGLYNIGTLGGCGLQGYWYYISVCHVEGFGLLLAKGCDRFAALTPCKKTSSVAFGIHESDSCLKVRHPVVYGNNTKHRVYISIFSHSTQQRQIRATTCFGLVDRPSYEISSPKYSPCRVYSLLTSYVNNLMTAHLQGRNM
jgi:hypothetical protein